jgi:undecaprenyl-diphosphatase
MPDEPQAGHQRSPQARTDPAPVAPSSRGTGSLARLPLSPVLLGSGFVGLFACLVVFGAIAEDVHNQEANALDSLANPLLHSLASPILDAVMGLLTDLGSTPVVVPLFVIAFGLLIWRRHRREAFFLAVSIAGSVALNESMKLIFHRPRPQLAWAQVLPEYSFPSGHAMNSLVFYVALALIIGVLWGRRAGLVSVVVAIVLAVSIGISRIYLGYHYFTDVIGGFAAGAAWLLIVIAAFDGGQWLRRRRADEAAR